MALRPGAIVGGYRILSVLGAGGMGTVYLAQHPSLPRQDAIKILSAELSTDPEFRARFEREANLAAGLDHPNIVSVYNRGDEDGQLWIAMQYIKGTDAAEEAKKGPAVMTPHRALRIVTEVGKGLDFAHRRGLLHRDVKPANFLLSNVDGDDDERVLLTDFGVAKSTEDKQDLTATGSFMATVAFAPPEQLSGGPLDHRADIYSLGCALYKLLTGQNPYPSHMPAVVMMGHLHEPPPRPSDVQPSLPRAIDAVIAKALAKHPDDRFSTCRDLAAAAADALSGRAPVRAPEATGPALRQPYRPEYFSEPTQREDPTAPRNDHAGPVGSKSLRRILVAGAAVAVVAALVAVFLVANPFGGSPPDTAQRLAQVRSDHPQFAGKSVTAVNFADNGQSVTTIPSDQATFLEQIGFRYQNPNFSSNAQTSAQKSPVTISSSDFNTIESAVIVVLRTDSQAGNGGLRGLPLGLTSRNAKLVIVDDKNTVDSFQKWNSESTDKLIDSLVPTIAKIVK